MGSNKNNIYKEGIFMKKWLGMSLSAVLTVSMLAGCGSTGTNDAAQTGPTTETVEESVPATEPVSESAEESVSEGGGDASAADQFDNKELNIAVFEGGFGSDYWYAVIDAFEEEYPGVTVNMQISPTIADTVRPQIASGNVPDFLVLNGESYSVITSLITERGLLDITDVFEGKALGSDEVLKDKILDGLLESGTCSPYGDGKIYQAPLNGAPTGLIYNKTQFEQQGWEVPVTWEEFFSLGDVAKEQGISLFTYQGIYPSYLQYMLLPSIASAVGTEGFKKITSYEEGSVIDSAAVDVLKDFERMADDGYILPGTVALNHTQSQQEQMMGKAIFIPCGTWIESEMSDAPRTDGYEFAMAPAPVMKDGDTRYVSVAMETMSIPAAAKNPELAKEFLRFLYTDDAIKLFAEKANGVGPTKDATEMVKDMISDSMYNMYGIFNEEGVVAIVPSFDVQAQGSKIDLVGELWNPASDVVNGTMTAEEWAESIEDAFAQIRAELEQAQ